MSINSRKNSLPNQRNLPDFSKLNATDLDPRRIVFYKKGLVIEAMHYLCEISYN
jgi:hypothetical protein